MRLILLPILLLLACAPRPESPSPSTSTSPPPSTSPPSPAPTMRWEELLARPKPTPTRVVPLGPAAHEVADLWLPDGAGPHPVVVMVHGGCWQKAIADRTLMNYAAEALRREGLAVWNIEYRGVDETGGGYPGTFLDVGKAADALRDEARRPSLKLDRVVVFGHSAGGHLALWLAARHRLPTSSALYAANPLPIAGVLNTGGLADLRASMSATPASCLADIAERLTGAATTARPDVFADTSPAELFPTGARLVSVSSARDRISPPALGEVLTQRAIARGDIASAVVIAGEGHVELIAPGTAAFTEEVRQIKALLAAP